MKTVKDILAGRSVITVQENDSVQNAAKIMADNKIGALPVLDGTRLVGIFTERDMITRVVADGKKPSETPIKDVMSIQLVIINSNDGYDGCLAKMKQANIRHLPVVEGENLIGIISIRDLIMIDVNEKAEQIEFLESYIYTVPPGLVKKH